MSASEPGRVMAPDKPSQAGDPVRVNFGAQNRPRLSQPGETPGRPRETPGRSKEAAGRLTGEQRRPLLSRGLAFTRAVAVDRSYATARGAIVGLFGLFFFCCLVAGWIHLEVLAGLGYVAGCLIAPFLVRDRVLIQVVVAPPAMFLIAVLISQALTAQGIGQHGRVLSVLEGTLLTLAALAPWLLAGTAGCVVAGWRRGLPVAVRQLQAELHGNQPGPPLRK